MGMAGGLLLGSHSGLWQRATVRLPYWERRRGAKRTPASKLPSCWNRATCLRVLVAVCCSARPVRRTVHRLYLMLSAVGDLAGKVVEYSSHVPAKERASGLERFRKGGVGHQEWRAATFRSSAVTRWPF